MLSAQGFKVDLSAIYIFFFNRGTIQLFFQEFFLRWRGRGEGAVRVEGGLSLITGCFLNGLKVIFVKNTANSVFGSISWRGSSADRRLVNLPGLALNERTFASQGEVKLLYSYLRLLSGNRTKDASTIHVSQHAVQWAPFFKAGSSFNSEHADWKNGQTFA